jgi:M6 family metalloprotease-like protein
MRNRYIVINLLLIFAVLSLFDLRAVADVASPFPIEYKQPDGSIITILLKGDEKVSWAETLDGYTLLSNSKGGWEYATKDKSGNLKISGVLAHKAGKRTSAEIRLLKKLEKNVRFSPVQIDQKKKAWETKYRSSELEGTGSFFNPNRKKKSDGLKGAEVFTPSGAKKLIMILIEYQDVKFSKTQSEFEGLMNTVGYSNNGAHGSVRDYFLETSYGQFDLTTTVAPHIYTASHNMAYYGADVDGEHSPKAKELVTEAILAADADGVDFSQYDNDGDGSVDGVYVVFAGYGQATSGHTDEIWPHAGGVSGVICDGKEVSKYSCSCELSGGSGSNMTTIGVICHEFGHVCGAPDYYDTDYATDGEFDGCGSWDVMDVGLYRGTPSGSRPTHFNPFEKIRAGWVTPVTLTAGTDITDMPDITTHPVVYQYNTTTADEYFLMENRQQTGFNSDAPGHGLLIYRYSKAYWDISRNKTAPQGFYPVCASAGTSPTPTSDPTSYGDISTAGCPFPGSSAKISFTDETTPSAKSWAGNNSYKPITGITEDNTAKTIGFTFMGGNSCTPPTTQATNFTVTNIQENELTLNWARGNGDKVLVLARRNSEINTTPLNGTVFNASSSFGAGDLIDAGTFVVYNGTETSITITDLLKNYTYYFAVYEYNTSGNCYLSPALTGNAATLGCSACVPTATSKGSFGITNVSFNTINNTSDYSASAYTNYAETITVVTAGTTYTLSVSTYSYSDQSVYTKAWIDWNNDCTFQSSEEYDLGSNINEEVVTKQISVPSNAYSGFVTMRIRTKYNSAPTSCDNNNYSEAEDYTLKITGGCTPPTIQASNFSVSNVQNEQATINWTRGNGDNVLVIARQGSAVDCNLVGASDLTASADFGTGAQIETGNYVVYNGTGNNITVTGLLQNAAYHFAVYEYNSTNCFLMPALTGSATTTTGCSACVPTAITKGSFGITNVSFNTLNNTSDYTASAYTNYAATTTNVTAGTTYTLSVSTSSYNGYSVYTKAWIDWNKDCTFQSSEEYDLGSNINVGIVTKEIQIPLNAYSGFVTMRIRTTWNVLPTSCGNNNYSEAEDYSLKIVGGCTPPTAQATSFSAANIQNEQATINWTRGNGDNVLVIARQGAAVDSYLIGVSDFTANAQFGIGAQIGTGNYVVYNGAGTNITVTGLVKGTTYYFAVYEYNSASCFLAPALTGNVTTFDEAIWTGTTSTDWFTTSNWNTGSLPTATTSVTIPSSPSNQPQINASGAVCKNITINSGATLAMSASTAYTLSVYGDWTNNGSNSSFSYGIGTVSFDSQTTNQTIGGSAQTDFYILKVNKGSISKILEATAVITLKAVSGNIILTAGILKISSTSTITPLTSTYLSINSSSGIWNNGGIINPTGKQCNVTGKLISSAGTSNFSFLLPIGSANNIQIDGGTINISSYFEPYSLSTDIMNYSQSGGSLLINSSNGSIPFALNAGSTFNMSGGTIVFQKASANTTTDFQNLASTYNVTGGTLQIGNASTLAGQTIRINSTVPIYNLVVNANNSPIAQLVTNGLTVKNDVTISGGTLNANNLNISVGGNWNNNGTFTPGSATVTFNGTAEQSLAGNAETTFNNLTVDNTVGVTSSGSALTTVNGTLLINSGKKLTIGSGCKLTAITLTNNSTASGVIIRSDATGTGSLIAGSTSGQATVESYLTANKWHIVSPTAAGGSISAFIQAPGNAIPSKTGSYGMMDYNETGNSWNSYYTSSTLENLTSGKGYSVRRTADGVVTFTGTLTSGTKTVNLTKIGTEGWNCVGNPYSSSISINTAANATNNFLKTNAIDASNLDASYACIYVWDQDASGYKILGNVSYDSRDLGQNIFQSGQGFFVKANNSGSSIEFTPAMQVHQPNAVLKSVETSWPGFELTATNTQTKASTMVVFNNSMSAGLDPTYDAGLLRGTSGLNLYTHLVDDNGIDFAIQCLPETYSSLVIPLGMDSKTGGEITFSAETVELPAACSVILEDKLAKTFTSLANGATYKTTVSAGTTAVGRFYIHTNNSTTGTSELLSGAFSLKAYPANGQIWIVGEVASGAKASLVDVNGRNLGTFNLQEGSRNSVSSAGLAPGVYLLNVNEANKRFNTRIVIY